MARVMMVERGDRDSDGNVPTVATLDTGETLIVDTDVKRRLIQQAFDEGADLGELIDKYNEDHKRQMELETAEGSEITAATQLSMEAEPGASREDTVKQMAEPKTGKEDTSSARGARATAPDRTPPDPATPRGPTDPVPDSGRTPPPATPTPAPKPTPTPAPDSRS